MYVGMYLCLHVYVYMYVFIYYHSLSLYIYILCLYFIMMFVQRGLLGDCSEGGAPGASAVCSPTVDGQNPA